MRYKWVLFDADGTLFDYEKAEVTALTRAFAAFGHVCTAHHAETYRRINSQIWQDFELGKISSVELRVARFERLFETLGFAIDPAAFSRTYLEHLGACSQLVEGAETTVRALYGKVGLVLITNGFKDVQRRRVGSSSIRDYFADVVISEEVGAAKPDGRIFDVAFSKIGDPAKADVLMVGDSLSSDIKGGCDYGIDTCWFNPAGKLRDGDVTASYEIAALRDVLEIVGIL